ncbi:MAG: hypothetical protein HQM09_03080 [Candidatus Riflebacteria bacterium]|nr:hypothetical protein [Candidatus Riflebacteria bacterium]
MKKLVDCIERGLASVANVQEKILEGTEEINKVAATLDPQNGTMAERKTDFWKLHQSFETMSYSWYAHMTEVMTAFSPGLFVGPEDGPVTNDDLERFFKIPKSHERKIHGHRHAGIRIVIEGPTLIPTLDAHARHPNPFHPADLIQFSKAVSPKEQLEATKRRKIMRKARTKKNRITLLANLEKRHKGDG